MRLSKRTEYGLRAIVQLGRLWPATYVQSRDLASGEDLPNKFLESILLALRRGGFLESKVGSGGGYKLSRAPRQINIGDVVRRLEGRLTYADAGAPPETSPGKMAVRLINERLTQATDDVMNAITLETLMEEIAQATSQSQEMYYI